MDPRKKSSILRGSCNALGSLCKLDSPFIILTTRSTPAGAIFMKKMAKKVQITSRSDLLTTSTTYHLTTMCFAFAASRMRASARRMNKSRVLLRFLQLSYLFFASLGAPLVRNEGGNNFIEGLL
jgi:hypothetical protein